MFNCELTLSVLFNQLNILPRWIVFLFDLFIGSISFTLAYLIRISFELDNIDYNEFYKGFLIINFLNLIAFFGLKTYTGIIRYTSAQDSFRILGAVLLSNVIFGLANLLSIVYFQAPFISNLVLMINALTCFLLMVSYRMLAKHLFLYVKNLKLDTTRVVIYGVGEAGVAAKRTFDHDTTVNKNIIAFVDDDHKKVGNSILGVKILDVQGLLRLINNKNVDELIFATHSMPIEDKNKIVDLCLDHDVKVLTIPPHNVWSGGKLQVSQIQHVNIEDLLNRKSIEIDVTGIQKELKGKRVLITGAAGSIGSEIVRQLLNFDIGLIIMCDQSETALHHLYLEMEDRGIDANCHAFVGDVKDEKRMTHLFETYKPHYVYHAAAYKHVPLMEDNPCEAIKTNVLGTRTIANLAVKYGVSKFVMISTDKAVNPTNIMGASKRIAEIYVQSLNNILNEENHSFTGKLNYLNYTKSSTKFITTRFGNVLGSNGSVIPRFREQIERGGPVTVTHPEITRYFMTIPEACRLVLEAGCMGKGGEIYIFDMGKSVKIIDLAKRMIRLAGLIPNKDIKIQYSGLRPGEKLYEELLNNQENTLPTHHEKIMIGKVRVYTFSDIDSQIDGLINYSNNNDDMQLVKSMKLLVHEFKSKNSVFEELDRIVKIS